MPAIITCPFTVVIDTREKQPFAFAAIRTDAKLGRRPLIVQVVRRAIWAGDYSIDGYDRPHDEFNRQIGIAIERKGIADLFSTIGQARARFIRELHRLVIYRVAAVVVEAEWSEIFANPPAHSRLPAKNVWRSVLAWQQRFPSIHWHFCPGRAFAEVTTFRVLERFWKERMLGNEHDKNQSETAS